MEYSIFLCVCRNGSSGQSIKELQFTIFFVLYFYSKLDIFLNSFTIYIITQTFRGIKLHVLQDNFTGY